MKMSHRIVVALLAASACRETSTTSVPEWQLVETLRIGADTTPQTEFHRVAGAVRLPNGEIAVADGGSQQVRFFGAAGAYRRAFGRQGAGPGEFQGMSRPMAFGDTIAIHDSRNSRLTLMLGDSLLETRLVRAANSTGRYSIYDRLDDGRWLAGTSVSPRFTPRPYRDSIAIAIFPTSGDGDIQLVGWFPGPWIVSIEGQVTGLAGFFTWATSRAAGNEVIVLDGDQERLRRFDAAGTEMPGVMLPVSRQPLTPDVIDQARQRETAAGGDPIQAQKWLDLKYDPGVLPGGLPFRGFMIDSEGMVWLEEYRDEGTAGKYFVLSPESRLVATVNVPAGFRATDIGRDYCLGIGVDPDGVERIVMYRLTRG
jgi:hypothetical protein